MLTKLERLEEQAHKSDIQIYDFALSLTKKAACYQDDHFKAIAINRQAIESRSEEVALLAEEMGHFETGTLYIIDSTYNTSVSRSNRIKYEAQAMRWAYKNYLSPDEIEEAVEIQGLDEYAIAEHCGVPVAFLRGAVEYYRSCGLGFCFDEGDYYEYSR